MSSTKNLIERWAAPTCMMVSLLCAASMAPAATVLRPAQSFAVVSGPEVPAIGAGPSMSIYWQVGAAAPIGAGTAFAGTLLTGQSLSLKTSAAVLCGRAIALYAAIATDGPVLADTCVGSLGGRWNEVGSLGLSSASRLPEPLTWVMLLAGFSLAGATLRRARNARRRRR